MRWIYLAVVILIAAAAIIFALQNFEIVTMSFLGFNARVPLALLVVVTYLLGAATGGGVGSATGAASTATGACRCAVRVNHTNHANNHTSQPWR